MRVSEICVKRIRVNQGLGVFWLNPRNDKAELPQKGKLDFEKTKTT